MKLLLRAVLILAALFLFILGLEMLKRGAGGVMPFFRALQVDGALNTFGLGWLMAYGVLSGSPVAAVALSLFGAGEISDVEALGMIAGSRFGAAFVVLLAGAIYYFRRRGEIATVATGILCLLVTWTIYTPATILAYLMLATDLLSGIRLPMPETVSGVMEAVFHPILALIQPHLHRAVLFALGLGVLVGSFGLFDRALPQINPEHSRFRQISFVIYKPQVMFLLGVAVTCITLSVSVSLGLLVPLSAKGYVRRENIVPYIMGANISTFLDTLVVALLVGDPRAFTIVIAELLGVGLISIVVLVGFYASYRDGLEWFLEWATLSRRAFIIFVGGAMLVPLVLMLT